MNKHPNRHNDASFVRSMILLLIKGIFPFIWSEVLPLVGNQYSMKLNFRLTALIIYKYLNYNVRESWCIRYIFGYEPRSRILRNHEIYSSILVFWSIVIQIWRSFYWLLNHFNCVNCYEFNEMKFVFCFRYYHKV